MSNKVIKVDYGEHMGSCAICDISLWSSANNKPVIWPCGIKKCPYEDPKKQNKHNMLLLMSQTGSGLAQIN